MAYILILSIGAPYVIRMVLINAVIAEVHAWVPQVIRMSIVFDCGQPHDALFE